jgi:hypothetical protein
VRGADAAAAADAFAEPDGALGDAAFNLDDFLELAAFSPADHRHTAELLVGTPTGCVACVAVRARDPLLRQAVRECGRYAQRAPSCALGC